MEFVGNRDIGVMGGRGHGRMSRGRGRGRGRGGSRGRSNEEMPPPIPTLDDSGSDDDEVVDTSTSLEDEFGRLGVSHALDGESDDDIGDPVLAIENSPLASASESTNNEFQELVNDVDGGVLGNSAHKMSYIFERGDAANSLMAYRHMQPIDIVLDLSQPFFNVLKDCSNNNEYVNITMKDIYCYHAFLVLRVHMNLDTNDFYYNPPGTFTWSDDITKLLSLMPKKKFYFMRKHLKAYKPEDQIPSRSKGWKVARAVEEVRKTFVRVHQTPGEFLSFDEGMAQGSSSRNPIYVSLGKAKPLEGYRFFLLVDYETKIVLNFMMDMKDLNAENCRDRPGRFVGAIVDTVITGAMLRGKWYKVMQDNYYQTVAVAVHMRDNRNILCAGTAQKKNIDKTIYFGRAKRPKPSRQNPKGSMKIAWNETLKTYEYAWMDSSLVYFIDPMYGPGEVADITRKDSTGERITYQVPRLISDYNRYMHGVDVFDQIRKLFGCDLVHATKKYTVRVFEILFSMVMGQAYNIHRTLHANTPLLLTHTAFKIKLIEGFINHHVVRPPSVSVPAADHTLVQYPMGSGGMGQKRKRVVCRQCPNLDPAGKRNNKRNTNWYCNYCNVGLHPDCFAAYHDHSSPAYLPPRRVNPLGSPVAAMTPGSDREV
jgi:hypothetical protein